MKTRLRFIALFLFGLWLTGMLPVQAQVGHVLSGVGPVDQAWAGAGTANPQDALGALHWNPASITRLSSTSLTLSLQLLRPTGSIVSAVGPNTFGPGFPNTTLSGTTDSEAGPFPIPALGFVHAPAASRWAFGLSAFGVGGFGVDYEQSATNPIVMPQPPGGMGMGAMTSAFQLLQVMPTVAYQLTDHLALGVAPTLNVSSLEVTPFPATVPNDANGDGYGSYPEAPQAWTFGYGVQVGLHLADLNGFHVGASFKSPQVFDDFEFDSVDEVGNPQTFTFNLDYPMILSLGVGYSGLDRWEFAADVRYIDFEHTDGFRVTDEQFFAVDPNTGYPTGAVTGFGWKSIWTVAAGLQYDLTSRLPLRVGYSFNQNPIDDAYTFFNCVSPAIIQHRVSGGLSYALSDRFTGSAAVQYGFRNDIQGTWMHPQFGSMAPTLVKSELSTFFIVLGVEMKL